MEQLVIRLGSVPSDPIKWLVWSSQEQEIIASGELPDAENLSTLQSRAGDRPVTALTPTSDVLLKQVELPAKAGRKVLTAIPYMLEDDLSGDVDDAFFALGERQGNHQAVAIVTRDKMNFWLAQLKAAGLHCDKMLPDILALPVVEDAWSLLQIDNHWLLRQGDWQGMQGEQSWMQAAVEYHAKRQEQPVRVVCYNDMQLPSLANIQLETDLSDFPMKLMAVNALSQRFNLLQGDYKQKKQNSGQLKQWRLPIALAASALLFTLVDKGIEVQRLSAQKQTLSENIKAEYQRAFPNARRIVNVRTQMQQKMKALEAGGGSTSMLQMLTQLQGAFSQSKVKPQTMRFDRQRAEIRMQAVAGNYEALETFKRLAEQQGFTVQQGAINNKDNQVVGSLAVRS